MTKFHVFKTNKKGQSACCMYLTYPLEYLYLLGSVSVSTPLVTPLEMEAVSPYPLVVPAAAAPLPVSGSSYTDKVLLNLRRNVSEELLEDDGSTAIEEDLNYENITEDDITVFSVGTRDIFYWVCHVFTEYLGYGAGKT